jgi:hypothetical protein
MTQPEASLIGLSEPAQYELRIQDHLDTRWAAWFDGLSIDHEPDGTSVIRGAVVDQAALHGLLAKVRDLGLRLIAVRRLDTNCNEETNA